MNNGLLIDDLLGSVNRAFKAAGYQDSVARAAENSVRKGAIAEIRQSPSECGGSSNGIAAADENAPGALLLICPICQGGCAAILQCGDCGFRGCSDCYEDHSHATDSETAAELYRDKLPKAAPVQRPEEAPEAEEPPRAVRIDRFRREPAKPIVNLFCTRCWPNPCTCTAARREVRQ
jgi:hypothetical protein